MKREELLRSQEYWIVQIQNDLYGMIEEYMKKNKLNRTELADKLKVTKGYITQLLNGDFDHKISKMVDLALLTGKAPFVHFVDLEKFIEDDRDNNNHIYRPDFKAVNYSTYTFQVAQPLAARRYEKFLENTDSVKEPFNIN